LKFGKEKEIEEINTNRIGIEIYSFFMSKSLYILYSLISLV
jgi:hypothetical protein